MEKHEYEKRDESILNFVGFLDCHDLNAKTEI